ncbi:MULTISPECIES: DMT family transporter [unclassified Pandoraea]|uniref:DMT family transporter n=1 Tax=unclassified Pandoraea TaxID=2624094 RepID=UPI000B3F6F27|nr:MULTISPECIES: DMT family transporter [unclassified Pandoraea]
MTTQLAYLAALGAALCWACSGMIAITPVRQAGSFPFNYARMLLVFAMLLFALAVLRGWPSLTTEQWLRLCASGLIGILVGDTILYTSLGRLGPRRNSIIFATNAPMTAMLGYFWLGEALGWRAIVGVALVTAGVALAIAFGGRRDDAHHWESVRGDVRVGVLIGLTAALCHSIGTLIAKPVMAAGVDPVGASAVRVGVSALGLTILAARRGRSIFSAFTPGTLALTALSGFVGVAVGMTLLLYGMGHGNTGVIATLSATTPVMVLPLLWIRTRQRPAAGAWVGALIASAGVAMIFNR